MLGNIFKIGIRILIRQRKYTLMNIIGLAIGIAVFVFIYLYVQSEIRYDRHWTDYRNIYRVTSEYSLDEKVDFMALTPYRIASDLKSGFPDVELSTNVFFTDPSDINDVYSIMYDEQVFEVPDITLSDSNLFRIFDYRFLEGDPETALSKPNTIVLSSDVAQLIFGDKPALGEKLSTFRRVYEVTGVFDKTCSPSHLSFDGIVSINSLPERDLQLLSDDWFWMTCYTYVKLHDTADYEDLSFRFNEFASREAQAFIEDGGLQIEGYAEFVFEAVSAVHFNTTLGYDSPSNIDSAYLYIFGIIAGFILLTASINYINLATARSLKRAKEIGMRKVLGAHKKQMVFQYISEAFILTFVAFVLALSLVELLMPQFNELVDKDLTLVGSLFSREGILFGGFLIISIILLSVVSGSFPAFVLTRFNPVSILKGSNFFFSQRARHRLSAGNIRKLLVTIQFVVSIGMIISTMIIYAQMSYLEDYDLGFNKDNVVVINVSKDTTYQKNAPAFLSALDAHPAIENISVASSLPGYTIGKRIFYMGNDSSQQQLQSANYFAVGSSYFELLDIKLLEGRLFSASDSAESIEGFIVNEAAVEAFELEQPIGTLMSLDGNETHSKIIGVVRDFHYEPLYKNIEPLVFMYRPHVQRYILAKIDEDKKIAAQSHIKNIWKAFNDDLFLHYTYLDEKLESLYHGDNKMLSLFTYFSIFVIFISSLGLYGLSSFLIEQRTKEIGIRKVLGGSEKQIVMMLAKDYLRLVLLSGLLASPLVYYLMNRWLDTFSFHIQINAWYFTIAILLTMGIAFFTIVLRSFKVVRQSPSIALKYE